MAILPSFNEVGMIDSYAPRTSHSSPLVTHANTAGNNLQSVGGTALSELPDPSIGGVNGVKILNGFSNGFRSMFNRLQAFSGAVLQAPSISNSVQGNVGTTARASKLYAGVMNQLVSYTPSQVAYVPSYIGAVTPQTVTTSGQ